MSDPRQSAFSMFEVMHRSIREMVLGGLYTKHTRKDTHLGGIISIQSNSMPNVV